MNNENDLIILLIFAFVVILFIVTAGLIDFVNSFSRELRYINNEIGHTEGAANRYWRRRRRRLWISLFPFVEYETDEEEP